MSLLAWSIRMQGNVARFAVAAGLLIGLLVVCPPAPGQTPANPPAPAAANAPKPAAPEAPKPAPPKEQPKIDPINAGLTSPDPAAQAKAIDAIKALWETDPNRAVDRLRNDWLRLLMDSRHYQEVADWSLKAILLQAPNTDVLEQFQKARVQALIALGKPDDALANAKSLYNVASMRGTADAIMMVARCLMLNPSGDATRIDRFKAQQLLGTGSGNDASLQEMAKGPSVLGSIKVSADSSGGGSGGGSGGPYDAAIRQLTGEDYTTLVSRGNLLLLADRPKEAREAFERAYIIADDKSLNSASENLARTMKAEDSNVVRANAWVLSIRPKPVPPAVPAATPGSPATPVPKPPKDKP